MTIHEAGIYHIYNRGNNKQAIFFSQENYFYFLRKCHRYLKPTADILAWCLMTNHFHFLLHITEKSLERVKAGGIMIPAITNGFRLLQSSYTKGVNRQLSRTGNLFQQKTKSKLVKQEHSLAITVFHYIHQNPVVAKLVNSPEKWEYSSYRDYTGLRSGVLCNKEKAFELLGLKALNLKIETMKEIEENRIKEIY